MAVSQSTKDNSGQLAGGRKAAVLGSSDFVMPFSALGMDAFAISEKMDDVKERASEILKDRYPLILVAENVAAAAGEVFDSVQDSVLPCILIVPFTTEPSGIATAELSESLKRATGVNIL